MNFNKYSAIYRNDNLIIDSESVQGKTKDIKEYFTYELASQCMSDLGYEEIVYNGRLILNLIDELENNNINDDFTIIVKYNPMGSLYFEEVI